MNECDIINEVKNVKIVSDAVAMADQAAKLTIEVLHNAIGNYGSAVWVLAGGSTPLRAYEQIALKYGDKLDWSKVTVLIGDERIGPLDGPDNNWHKIEQLIGHLPFKKIRPISDKSTEDVVMDYENQIATLPKADNGLPRFDLVWLGIGADGHTLSIFPKHSSLLPGTGGLVCAIYDSPKPPRERVSLTLRAMQGARNLLILAAGEDKKTAVSEALRGGHSPIALVASIVETHEGNTSWIIDKTAAPTD